MTNDTENAPSRSQLTYAGERRAEVAKHIDTLALDQRMKALRMAIETIGERTDDGAGVVTLAEAYYDFLTAGQALLAR